MKTYQKFIMFLLCTGCIMSGCATNETVKDVPKVKTNKEVDAPKDITYPKSIAKEDYNAQFEWLDKNPVNEQLLTSLEAFSKKSFQAIWNAYSKENINYSPVSMYYPLMLNHAGSQDETHKELANALHIQDKDFDTKTEMQHLYNQLYTDNGYDKLKIANSLWVDKDITLLNAFQTSANKDFYASVYATDFSKQESADSMAAWVREHTSGNIQPNIQVKQNTKLAILNTIDLKARWFTEFSKQETKEKIFYGRNNKPTKMPFMKANEEKVKKTEQAEEIAPIKQQIIEDKQDHTNEAVEDKMSWE